MKEIKDKDFQVPAASRVLNIIEYLSFSTKSATIKEISDSLGIPLVSVSRVVNLLNSRGYLKQQPGQSSTYSLGLKLLHISERIFLNLDIANISLKYMRILSEKTDQTSQLGILQNSYAIYIQQVFPTIPVSIIAPLHFPIAINTSASGKVLCAFRSIEQQKDIIESAELIKATENSIVDKNDFYNELRKVRLQGYATDYEEYAIGIGCLAAPIFDYLGSVIAAVGITGHIANYRNSTKFDQMRVAVIQAARDISKEMGFEAN